MNYYFITGTGSGIGKALAELLIQNDNNRVTGISRSNSINHPRFFHFKADLSDHKVTEKFSFTDFVKEKPDLIVFVNNAAVVEPVKYAGDAGNREIIDALSLNIIAPIVLGNTFIREFVEYTCPKIIMNIGSGASKNVYDGWSVYAASKAAINQYSMVVQHEMNLRNQNFRIFCVAPGIVDTPMQTVIRESNLHDFSRLEQFVAFKEQDILTKPEKVAERLANIMSNFASQNETLIWF